MTLDELITSIQADLRSGRFTSEASVSQGVVLPVLHELGWPVFNIHVVTPEYSVGGRRVDLALCHPEDKPAVFVEIKRVGQSEGADRQLFEYAFHTGVPLAILTDGQEWSFYLPGEQGEYHERRAYKLDLLGRSTGEIVQRFERYLSHPGMVDGSALDPLRQDSCRMSSGGWGWRGSAGGERSEPEVEPPTPRALTRGMT